MLLAAFVWIAKVPGSLELERVFRLAFYAGTSRNFCISR